MAWAKRHQLLTPARLSLSISAVDMPSVEEIGGLPADFPISGLNAYGHPGITAAAGARYGILPDRILSVAGGSSMGNFLTATACVQPGDRVVLEHPVYEPLLRVPEALGAEIVFVKRRLENGWAVDPAEVAAACGRKAALVILTNLHNPTGAGMPADVVRAAAGAAARAGAMLLVDEVYLDAAFPMDPRPAPAVTLAENAVSTASFTKAYGLGSLRSGWVAGPKEFVDRLKMIRDSMDVDNAYPADVVSLQVWKARERLLARSERRFRENWPVVEAWLAKHPAWRCAKPAGGFVCFPRVPDGIDVDRLLETLLREHSCAVTPGEFFGEPRHVRIGFGASRTMLEEGLSAIDAVAARLG